MLPVCGPPPRPFSVVPGVGMVSFGRVDSWRDSNTHLHVATTPMWHLAHRPPQRETTCTNILGASPAFLFLHLSRPLLRSACSRTGLSSCPTNALLGPWCQVVPIWHWASGQGCPLGVEIIAFTNMSSTPCAMLACFTLNTTTKASKQPMEQANKSKN